MYENTEFMSDLLDLIDDISDELEIEPPLVCIDKNYRFPTATTMAVTSMETPAIMYLNPEYFTPEVFGIVNIYILAHELRHIWQKSNGYKFSDYVGPGKKKHDDYNMQPQEIDANAYGLLYVRNGSQDDEFDCLLNGLFSDMSEECRKETLNRMDYILNDEYQINGQ